MYLRRPGRERVRIACTAAEPLLSLLSPCCVLMEPISNLQRGAVLFFRRWMDVQVVRAFRVLTGTFAGLAGTDLLSV